MDKTIFNKTKIIKNSRVELHDALNLTGAEISINVLNAKTNVPFVHSHKQNEEIYIILDGNGSIKIDNEIVMVEKGDAIRISPNAKRQIYAGETSDLKYLCIQVKENSLTQFTGTDAIIY